MLDNSYCFLGNPWKVQNIKQFPASAWEVVYMLLKTATSLKERLLSQTESSLFVESSSLSSFFSPLIPTQGVLKAATVDSILADKNHVCVQIGSHNTDAFRSPLSNTTMTPHICRRMLKYTFKWGFPVQERNWNPAGGFPASKPKDYWWPRGKQDKWVPLCVCMQGVLEQREHKARSCTFLLSTRIWADLRE